MADTVSPSSLKARLREGIEARRRGDREAAEAIFRDVLYTHPQQPDALNLLGVLLAERGRWREAVDRLKAAAAARPQSRSIAINLAQTLMGAGRPGDACHILCTLTTEPDTDARTRLLHVHALLADRRPEEAEDLARHLLADAPRDPELLCALGGALVQSERAEEAVPCYEAAIREAPGHSAAHNNLGTALEKLGRLTEAADAFAHALRHSPNHTGAQLNLGTVRMRLGDAAGAEAIFRNVLTRDPHNQRALAYLDIARQESGKLKPADARAALEPLIHEEDPGCPRPFRSLTDFHATLAKELYGHPARRRDVSGTATTGGFDALRLFDHEAPALKAFETQLRAAIDRHIDRLSADPAHPFLGRRHRRYMLDVWATFLGSGGYQFPHIHPSGWISGVYYVQVPAFRNSKGTHEGWIEFNRPDESFDYTFRPDVILKQPVPGRLLLFPSYAYHRTIPFSSGTDRISIAFDVKPAPA